MTARTTQSTSCIHIQAWVWPTCGLRVALFAACAVLLTPAPLLAAKVTECTKITVCYCVNDDLKSLIETKITNFREVLAAQRKAGKAIGYMSVPLSTLGGGYFNVNMEVAARAKAHVEKRFGVDQIWVLNPGVADANIPNGSGTDYMLMWATILEGREGLGEDFDFVYFVEPQDFARYFGLDGTSDMVKIEQYFDARLKTGPDLEKAAANGLTKAAFRNYYALKASTTFSKGAHDEWNIIRVLNQRRRSNDRYGIANQLAALFDGRGMPLSGVDAPTSEGYVGKCIN